MTVLWKRVIEVRVAGLIITEPKIEIDIKREASSTPASGSVSITNLSRDHEQQIHDRGTSLQVIAGHNNLAAVIFDGVVQKVEKERSGLSRITKLSLGGQAVAAGSHGELVTLSYDGEVPLRNIARDIVSRMGFEIGPLDAIPADAMRPWTFTGSGTASLNQLVRGTDLTWYEDDGVIRFNKRAAPQLDGDIVFISKDTGLIESPTITDDGVRLSSFLNPRLRIGGTVNLQSETISGVWKIVEVKHAGDNWDGQFRTQLDLRSI